MIRLRYFIILILTGCSHMLFAQQVVPAWASGADENDLSFGFSFSYISSSFKIQKKPNWRSPQFDADANAYVTDSLTSIGSRAVPGFAVGFLTRYRLTDHLEVRVNPSFIFADRVLNYTFATPSQNVDKTIQTTTINFPLLMKLKSDRIGNMRAYLVGGIKYSGALGSIRKDDVNVAPIEKMVKNVRGYSSYEVGAGFDIYFEYFKLSPEIKLSNTFGNMLVADNNPFSSPISKLSLHTLTFSLIFE